MQVINIFHIILITQRLGMRINQFAINSVAREHQRESKTHEMHFALWTPRNCSYAPRALISAADIANGNSVMGCWFKDAIKQSGRAPQELNVSSKCSGCFRAYANYPLLATFFFFYRVGGSDRFSNGAFRERVSIRGVPLQHMMGSLPAGYTFFHSRERRRGFLPRLYLFYRRYFT